MTYDKQNLTLYQNMVIERHKIYRARQHNAMQPWTTDPVLSRMKMTNMFRVLDPGSQFVFSLRADDPVDTITRLVFYRITNLPKTWDVMKDALGRYPVASDMNNELTRIIREYRGLGNRVFSGAYIIMPEPGLTGADKVPGAVNLARRFAEEKAEAFLNAGTQDERFNVLRSTPGLGLFLSMQILTDWGYLCSEEPDLSFVVAGPGARRGAKALNPSLSAEDVICDLTVDWADSLDVDLYGRSLTTMDVQNTMCEFSKYAREIKTPRKITAYKPAHPGPQPKPILPVWW